MRTALAAALLASTLFLPACGDQGAGPPGPDGGNGGSDSGSGNGMDSGSGSSDSGTDGGMNRQDAGGTTDSGATDSGASDSGFQTIPRTDWPVFQNPSNN